MCERSSAGSDTAGTKINPVHTLNSARACKLIPIVFTYDLSAGLSIHCVFCVYVPAPLSRLLAHPHFIRACLLLGLGFRVEFRNKIRVV